MRTISVNRIRIGNFESVVNQWLVLCQSDFRLALSRNLNLFEHMHGCKRSESLLDAKIESSIGDVLNPFNLLKLEMESFVKLF